MLDILLQCCVFKTTVEFKLGVYGYGNDFPPHRHRSPYREQSRFWDNFQEPLYLRPSSILQAFCLAPSLLSPYHLPPRSREL